MIDYSMLLYAEQLIIIGVSILAVGLAILIDWLWGPG